MRSLFEISSDLLELDAKLAEAGGEIGDDEAGKALEAFFDQLGEERDTKIDNYCALIREMESRAQAREIEADRLTELAADDREAVERLKKRLKSFFELQKITKLDTARFRLSIVGNGGKAPLIVPEEWQKNPAAAPEKFHRKKIELDKDLVRLSIEGFNQMVAGVIATAEMKAERELGEEERQGVIAEWLEQTEPMRKLKELIEGCAIGSRGTQLRIK